MKISKKPIEKQGVQTQEIIIDGQTTPALVFRVARLKQLVGLVICAVFIWLLVVMSQHSGEIKLDLKGIPIEHPVLVQLFCWSGILLFGWVTILLLGRLIRPPFVALTAQGVFISQARPRLFIDWTWIMRLREHQHERIRSMAIVISDLHSKPSLKPFYKRMNWTADKMGFHYGIAVGAFVAKPELFIFAIDYFYQHPEKRDLLGSEAGLRQLEDVWKNR